MKFTVHLNNGFVLTGERKLIDIFQERNMHWQMKILEAEPQKAKHLIGKKILVPTTSVLFVS